MAPGLRRRDILAASVALLAGPAMAAVAQAPAALAPDTWVRLVCDLGGRTVFSVTQGMVWGFRPQADGLTTDDFAKRLYGYQSLLARQARHGADGSIRVMTKGWSFYLDPVTLEPVLDILNPYTGRRVSCPPLSGPASTAVYGGPAPTAPWPDLSVRRLGDHVWLQADRISRFKPADVDWYKLEADFTTYAVQAGDLDNPRLDHIPSTWSHSLVAEWQTWMLMHGQPGHILFQGAGAALTGPDAIPPSLKAAIDRQFPGTLAQVLAWG